jgi:sialate O-acetylesterase
VGARLALAARGVVYGEAVEFSGPLFREATPEGTRMRVYFTHGHGLVARGGALEGFEVAGEDRRFHAAAARVDGDTVVVSAADVSRPMYVRYAWANAPMTANLYNGAGLPAAGFISEPHIPVPCAGSCGR